MRVFVMYGGDTPPAPLSLFPFGEVMSLTVGRGDVGEIAGVPGGAVGSAAMSLCLFLLAANALDSNVAAYMLPPAASGMRAALDAYACERKIYAIITGTRIESPFQRTGFVCIS